MTETCTTTKRFALGQIVITPNALDHLDPADIGACLRRHACGDWGNLDPHDVTENELSLKAGFRLLSAGRGDARLLLVGKGERRDALEELVKRLGLERRVLFAGYRDADLPAVLGALDVFVLLGAGSDDSCRAALEAMAAGRPVLAARVGALPDAVVHGETGLLLDEPSPEAVAASLARLLSAPTEARAMGEAGRRRALELFTSERHAAAMEALYVETIRRLSAAP